MTPGRADDGLADAIRRSQSMLEGDWDEGESPRPSRAAWECAVRFLMANADAGATFPPPRILPGPDGGIDLHWEFVRCELLVNVPADGGVASFYGDDKNRASTTIKGTISLTETHRWLFEWLVQVSS